VGESVAPVRTSLASLFPTSVDAEAFTGGSVEFGLYLRA
jgi:hypothetical protein